MSLNLCIPQSIGVAIEFGQPPNWLPGATRQDKTLDDPRWDGAAQQAFGDNASNETEFLALTDQAQKFLYLSWRVKSQTDGADNTDDVLYVGFIPDDPTTHGPGFIIALNLQLQLPLDPTRNPHEWLDVPNFNWLSPTYTRTGTGVTATWNQDGTILDGIMSDPWIKHTRLWVSDPTFNPGVQPTTWAFQMKIPLGVPLVQQASNPVASMIAPDKPFRMWYSFGVAMPLPFQLKQITWPNDVNAAGGNDYDVKFTPPPTLTITFPNPDAVRPDNSPIPWGTVTLGNCPGQGVSLTFGQVGSLNPLGSTVISLNKTNTLFANPTNNSTAPVPVNALFARFRLANWGSMYIGPTWDDIKNATTDGSHVPNTSAIPPNTTLPQATPAIHFDWTLDATEVAKYKEGGTLNNSHQCMLVELTSTGSITFDRDSVWENMDFQNTSLVIEDAQISIGGLPKTLAGHRDVYLYVERIDLPSHIESDPCRFEQEDENVEEVRAELNRRAQEGNLTLAEAIEAGFPTYRVHVYHATGEKFVLKGIERDILHVQPSFGYFLLHDGPLFGWDHRLEGAIQLAPNYYKIPAIPDGQSAKVTVSVEALEQPRGGKDSGFMVQSTVGRKGDFLVVVPEAKAGLSECTRSNDDTPTFPWGGQRTFGAEVGLVDSVSLIQSNYGTAGNFEVIARVGDRLVHFWRSVTPNATWYGPTTIVDKGVIGNPALIQGSFGKRGNFELVVPVEPCGIAHYWRSNDDPHPTWQLSTVFAELLGKVDAVALIQSNFGQPGPGHLEVIARVGDVLYHIWRDSSELRLWREPVKFFSGATGIPGFIQSNFGSKGDFEVVTPLAKGGLADLRRNNDEPATFPWREITTFGSGQVTAASLMQSNFTTASGGPGDFEVAARVGGRTALYWRRDTPPLDWIDPQDYACS